jgi:DNA-binding NtrC family response regulator
MDTLEDIKTLSDKERELLQKALAKAGWDLSLAARLLQIPLAALKEKIKAHGLRQSSVADAANSQPVAKIKRRKK